MAFKILLADDSVPAQKMGKKILNDAGYEVLTVSNGLEALRKIADAPPDVAILDIFMPGYTGLEVCERLRASAATAELPVILTVGKLEPYRAEDGESVRSNAVIVKPFSIGELTAAVRSLIGAWPAREHGNLEAGHFAPAHDTGEDLAVIADEQPSPGVHTDFSPSEALDEPLFVESTAAANEAPMAMQEAEASVSADEPDTGGQAMGAESMLFNPDAGHTPFSASSFSIAEPPIEPPPSDSHFQAADGPSAFTGFDLEQAAAPYSVEPSPVEAAVEPWQSALEADIQDDAAAESPMAGAEPITVIEVPAYVPSVKPVEAVESEAASGAAAVTAVPDSSPLEVPADAPAIGPEGVAPGDAVLSMDAGEAPEAMILEDAASNEIFFPTAEELAQEEEARRRAFEELFNSDVPFPLEGDSVPFSASATVTPPNLVEDSTPEAVEIEPAEPALEEAMDTHPETNLAPASVPEVVEVEPIPAVEPGFENELLLEGNPPAGQSSIGIEQHAAEELSPVSDETDPMPANVASDPVQQFRAEAPAEAPESVNPAMAENEAPARVFSPERSQLFAEVAKVGAMLVQMNAVRQAGRETELMHSGLEYQPEAAPYGSEALDYAGQAESLPVQAVEEAGKEAQIETEPQPPVDAPVQLEATGPELFSSPLEMTPSEPIHSGSEATANEVSPAAAPARGLSESERVHKAVELVFDRFRPLLVAAIVRELARLD